MNYYKLIKKVSNESIFIIKSIKDIDDFLCKYTNYKIEQIKKSEAETLNELADLNIQSIEDFVLCDCKLTYMYSRFVLEDRFLKGEDAISKESNLFYSYIKELEIYKNKTSINNKIVNKIRTLSSMF
jgi:hypothetical protein